MWEDPTSYADLAVCFARGEYATVAECAPQAIEDGRYPPDRFGHLLLMHCQSLLYTGQPDEAVEPGSRALRWAEEHGDWDLDGATRINLGCALGLVGRASEARALFEGYFTHRHRYREALRYEAYARFNLGVFHRQAGALEEAVRHYRLALKRCEADRDEQMALTVRDNLVWALMLLKDLPAAAEQLATIQEYVNRTLDISKLQMLMIDLAHYHLIRGELEEAKHICVDLVAALDEKERAANLSTAFALLAQVARREGKQDEARRLLLEAQMHALAAGRLDLQRESERLLAEIEGEEGAS
jgi:tetratricopeptide (TPR) repeat protein